MTPGVMNLRATLQACAEAGQAKVLSRNLLMAQVQVLLWDWPLWARPYQLARPDDWCCWLCWGGRGFGKARSGAEWIRMLAASAPLHIA